MFWLREKETATCQKLGLSPANALRKSVYDSCEASAIFVNSELIALWGHGPRDRLAGTGTAWFLALPGADEYHFRIARASQNVIAYLLTIYNRLEVFVDAEFLQSIEWLQWLGFAKHEPAFLHKGFPVIFMYKDRSP